MRWNQKKTRRARARNGFSFLELLITMAILTAVIGVVTDGMMQIQKKSASDINKIGVAQESRQFMDQILRDLRQAGYPGVSLFDSTTLNHTVNCTNDSNITATPKIYAACGLISFSATAIQFEGDVDGSGVSEVYLQAVVPASGSCPCTVQRGTVLKSVGGTPDYYTELDNIMSQNIFTAYKFDGSAYNSATDSLSLIKNIGITLYVRNPVPDNNATTVTYPTTTMVSQVRINN
jgi:prepilin-type N-terminal cleavage/methylation domain-containing protein